DAPARNDFAVDAVGDAQLRAGGDEAKVSHVLHVVGGQRVIRMLAGQQATDDAVHALLAQLVGELIQVRGAALDEPLARRSVVRQRHRLRAVQ
ncbi:hypothetical protein H4F85_29115, partial [Citrobacter braakii]|nr:hypothetical protein [Citrobacter braakii]